MLDYSNQIELKCFYSSACQTLTCYGKKGEFNIKITYSNVKIDDLNGDGLNVYVEDFIEEFKNSLNKSIKVYYEA